VEISTRSEIHTVAVIGLGYVGLNLAIAAGKNGLKVIGFDSDSKKVSSLLKCESYVEGISNAEIEELVKNGIFSPVDAASEISKASIVVIAVPTPLDGDRNPDLTFLNEAISSIAIHGSNDCLIINESTSHPGTLRNLIAKRLIAECDKKFNYASAPERVDPINKIWNIQNTPRLVSGLTAEAHKSAVEFYQLFCESVIGVSTPEVAESAKLFENSFRQVNIALVNEFAQIAHKLGVPVREVLDAANTKPFGFMKFLPGAGVGGHCIPVDPIYLAYSAKQAGIEATFINRANEVNHEMPSYLVERIMQGSGGSLHGKSVVVVGVSYKPNVSDTRETPAAALIDLLRSEGASVTWNDDLVHNWRGETSSQISGADIAVLVTKHDALDLDAVRACSYVFDCTGTMPGVDGI
jgi:UDP-N-acetyl-D-glucosamine dehydrogenase